MTIFFRSQSLFVVTGRSFSGLCLLIFIYIDINHQPFFKGYFFDFAAFSMFDQDKYWFHRELADSFLVLMKVLDTYLLSLNVNKNSDSLLRSLYKYLYYLATFPPPSLCNPKTYVLGPHSYICGNFVLDLIACSPINPSLRVTLSRSYDEFIFVLGVCIIIFSYFLLCTTTIGMEKSIKQ